MSKHQLEDPEAEVEATLPRKKSKKEKKAKHHKHESEAEAVVPAEDRMVVDSEPVDVVGEKKEKKSKKEKKHKKKHHPEEAANGAEAEVVIEEGEKKSPADATDGAEKQSIGESDEKPKEKKHKKDKKHKHSHEAVDDTEETAEEKPKKKQKKDKKQKHSHEAIDGADESVEEKPKEKQKDKKAKETSDDAVSSTATTETAHYGQTNGNSNGAVPPTAYAQAAALTALPESEISSFLSAKEITITDPLSDAPTLRPITQFSYIPSSTLISKSPFASFKSPTPIQAASWPFGLSGRDIVGVAETGSGKTIAFGLPLVEAVLAMPQSGKKGTIRAAVVSPTRELAMQTAAELSKLGGLVGLKTVCVYGGASKDDQRVQLRKADIIVATPGRLKDFLEEGSVQLSSAKFVVLDEADRMLDKGFEDDIKLILGHCAPKGSRQTLMFTATWPQDVVALASTFMVSPVKIQIGGNGSGELQANVRIEQKVEVVDPRGKEQRLLQILKAQPRNERVLVFCLYKKEATRVEGFLQQRGIKVVAIHGDLRQEQRTRSLDAFKSGETPVLVATDVAARGLDIPEVKLVVNVTVSLSSISLPRLNFSSNVACNNSSLSLSKTTFTASDERDAPARLERPSRCSPSTTRRTRASWSTSSSRPASPSPRS